MEEQDRIIEEAEMKADMHEGKKEKSDQQTMLYMELKSNVAQSSLDVDIETMLQSSSLEDFMDQLLKGKLEQKEQADRSKIKEEEKDKEGIFNPAQQSEVLRREAMLNLKKKRIELKQKSKIFLKAEDPSEKIAHDIVDLTKQTQDADVNVAVDEIGDMDDYDLLDANIDPYDWKSLRRKDALEREIHCEAMKLHFKNIRRKCKAGVNMWGNMDEMGAAKYL